MLREIRRRVFPSSIMNDGLRYERKKSIMRRLRRTSGSQKSRGHVDWAIKQIHKNKIHFKRYRMTRLLSKPNSFGPSMWSRPQWWALSKLSDPTLCVHSWIGRKKTAVKAWCVMFPPMASIFNPPIVRQR